MDCSATAAHQMAKLGLGWPQLDAIWISHFHMDHVGGLGPLLAGTKHAPEIQHRRKHLTVYGPEGIEGLFDGISSARDYKLREQPFPLDIAEIEAMKKFEIVPGVEALAISTPHTPESHAIHIRDGEHSIMYSADTGFDERVATLATNVDLMLIECSFVHKKPSDKHLVLKEAIHLIRKAKPRRAMLTHFYPEWDQVDFAKEVQVLSPMCEVLQAEDGLEVRFYRNENT